jgi:hypothetical protein
LLTNWWLHFLGQLVTHHIIPPRPISQVQRHFV